MPADRILVLLRPEKVQLTTFAPGSPKNSWAGAVKEKTFLGDFIDCQIDCEGFSLRAKIDPYSKITEGDKVFVSADAARCAVIRVSDG